MRKEKVLLLDEIKENIENAKGLIIAKYFGLTPKNSWELSQNLNLHKSNFKIVKKRILLKALKECNLDFGIKKFEGHIGVLFVKGDPIEATKVFVEYSGNNQKMLEILVGLIDGKICFDEDIKMISRLPKIEDLKKVFLFLFENPMTGILSVFEKLLASIPCCLNNKKK
ncbi:MAG: hypothetical protein AMS24_03270 [Chlamydiae bacterium SM23_39]|nr:MAG: hypothetical protein AMS24_03270 [Chlamydiae bacterium SM23_39]